MCATAVCPQACFAKPFSLICGSLRLKRGRRDQGAEAASYAYPNPDMAKEGAEEVETEEDDDEGEEEEEDRTKSEGGLEPRDLLP